MNILSLNRHPRYFVSAASVLLISACSAPLVNTEGDQYSANSHYCKSLRSELNNSHAKGYSSLKPNQNNELFNDEKYEGENHRLRVERAYEKDCESLPEYIQRTTVKLESE